MCQPAPSCLLPLSADLFTACRDRTSRACAAPRNFGRSPGEVRTDSAFACNAASVFRSSICPCRFNKSYPHRPRTRTCRVLSVKSVFPLDKIAALHNTGAVSGTATNRGRWWIIGRPARCDLFPRGVVVFFCVMGFVRGCVSVGFRLWKRPAWAVAFPGY